MAPNGYVPLSQLPHRPTNKSAADGGSLEDLQTPGPYVRRCTPYLALSVVLPILVAQAIIIVGLLWKLETSSASTAFAEVHPDHANEFQTQLGRDPSYMSIDHEADSLWDVYLEERLEKFSTPEVSFKRREFSM